MNRMLAIVGIGIGALFLLVGLIFLCAAAKKPTRLGLAVLLLSGGAALAGGSTLVLRREQELQPEALANQITTLARQSNGEVTLVQIVAELGVPNAAAQEALVVLVQRREAMVEQREARQVYLFPGLKVNKVEKFCVYCGTKFPVAQSLTQCPNCGSGEITTTRD